MLKVTFVGLKVTLIWLYNETTCACWKSRWKFPIQMTVCVETTSIRFYYDFLICPSFVSRRQHAVETFSTSQLSDCVRHMLEVTDMVAHAQKYPSGTLDPRLLSMKLLNGHRPTCIECSVACRDPRLDYRASRGHMPIFGSFIWDKLRKWFYPLF